MNIDSHSFSSPKNTTPPQVNLDDFNISEDSFKPMTKGLGFHQEQKRTTFKHAPKDIKPIGQLSSQSNVKKVLSPISKPKNSQAQTLAPTGLEAFYGAKGNSGLETNIVESKIIQEIGVSEIKSTFKTASTMTQFFAWMIDLIVVLSFVGVTGALLVLASGINFQTLARIISNQDLIAFTSAIFSIYYLLYFTILDLSASPGKTIMGLRLLKLNNGNVSVKHTFTRALISLLSSVALFLPMFLDFQGRLSDTKVVK